MKDKKTKIQVTIYISEEVKEWAQERAKLEDRTLSNTLSRIIEQTMLDEMRYI